MNTENKSSVLVIKDRGTGKSTQLVYTSAVTQYPIIVQRRTSIMHLMDLANELGVVIPTPMTVDDYKPEEESMKTIFLLMKVMI